MQFLTARGGEEKKKKKRGGDVSGLRGAHTQELPSSEEPDATAKNTCVQSSALKIMECECWPVSNVPSMFF